jgi:hypothetical protein
MRGMKKIQGKKRWLALVVTTYLLSGATGLVWAAPISVSTTSMVNPSTNISSNIQAYNSINVTQASANSSVSVGVADRLFGYRE